MANEAFMYTPGRKFPYKICPETDAEELAHTSDPQFSIIQKLNKHEEPLWADRVRRFKAWYDPVHNKN